MLKNGQTYLKTFAVFRPQDFSNMLVSSLCIEGLSTGNNGDILTLKRFRALLNIYDAVF